MRLNIGKLAKMADGSAVIKTGRTSVLTTAVVGEDGGASNSFLPLTVNYRQKSAAAGRIPTSHLRRDLGLSDNEILTARMIDRSVRPLFSPDFVSETQIICNLMAVDPNSSDPAIAALNGASAALAAAAVRLEGRLPWRGPVGSVRVGYCKNEKRFLVNPSRRVLGSSSDLDLVISGVEDGKIVMLESEAKNIDRSLFLEGIEIGLENCVRIAKQLGESIDPLGKAQELLLFRKL